MQHIIFQKTLSFFSRMLIVLSSCQITNWLKKRLKMDSKLKFLSNCFELKSWKKKEMRCLNTLGIKCIMTKLYIYRKRIFVRMHLINGEMIFTDRYFFSHGTANSCGVMIGFHGNKKKKNKIKCNKIRTASKGRVIVLGSWDWWWNFFIDTFFYW